MASIPPEQLKFYAEFIEKNLGIIYQDTNFFQLEHRLLDVMTQMGLSGPDELYSKARAGMDPTMRELLLDLATNNETSFFRDVGVFQTLQNHIIPMIASLPSAPPIIRVWSAAGSTGQEAYSIAMVFEQMKEQGANPPDYFIHVSDFSERVLNRARDGVYSQLEIQRGLPARFMVNFFTKDNDNKWSVKPELKANMSFKRINLLDPWFFAQPFHVVFCRNVLIYQSVENKAQVVDRIYHNLVDGGVLVMGAAESLLGVSDKFEQMQPATSVFYRKPLPK
ncbi:MAG TPA: protein-glutamate O-methyltransferase CheR [Pseudobdellovibrionaceae bacterium]|nr:protein-glutamate O-methyltransferase CheR [Pseudobdellovibrionaceae bacterium]